MDVMGWGASGWRCAAAASPSEQEHRDRARRKDPRYVSAQRIAVQVASRRVAVYARHLTQLERVGLI